MISRDILLKCNLCPRKCGANRSAGEKGFCGAPAGSKAARCALHFWEEPPVSGDKGSGAVFFSHCPLKCVYCQNKKISSGGFGEKISAERLAGIFFELKEKGAHNINLVSPTPYVAGIAEAVKTAKARGFDLPFVYNTGGYELPETIAALKDTADIYLTDFKYMDDSLSEKYSSAPNYVKYAKLSLVEMVKTAGVPKFDRRGIMLGGVIVRHLLLPGQLQQAKRIVRYLYKEYGDGIYLSLMNQYTPALGVPKEIDGRVSKDDYRRLIDYADRLGVSNCFIQEGDASGESYIPDFDLSGVL